MGTISLIHLDQVFGRLEARSHTLGQGAFLELYFFPSSPNCVPSFEGTVNEIDYLLKTFACNDAVIRLTESNHFEVVHG